MTASFAVVGIFLLYRKVCPIKQKCSAGVRMCVGLNTFGKEKATKNIKGE
jgi:hypothetical protein